MEIVDIDIRPGSRTKRVHLSQYDTGNRIGFKVFEDGLAYNLTGLTVSISIGKNDSHIVEADREEIQTELTNYCEFVVTNQMSACYGDNLAELKISNSSGLNIATANFVIEVEKSPTAGGIQSESEIINLERQVEQIVSDKSYTRSEVDAIAEEIREEIPSTDTFATVELVNSEIERVEGLIPDVSELATKTELNSGLSEKADKSTTYTKTETDMLLNNKADVSDIPDVSGLATKTELTTGLNSKADKETTYTKTESDAITDAIRDEIPDVSGLVTKTEFNSGLGEKADKTDTYTKDEVDTALSSKADASDIPDMSDYYTKTATDSLLSNKADTSALDDKADKSTTYTKSEVDAALIEKADVNDLPDMSEYYNKSDVDNLLVDKADTDDLSTVATSGSYNDLLDTPTVPTKTSELTNDSDFVTTSGTVSKSNQLATARTIGISTGATGTATAFDGTDNITIPVTEVKESYLTWGGKAIADDVSPIDAACIDEFGHNKLAFLPAECINVAYTTDGGKYMD